MWSIYLRPENERIHEKRQKNVSYVELENKYINFIVQTEISMYLSLLKYSTHRDYRSPYYFF